MTHHAPEGSIAVASPDAQALPTWNLADLYERPDSPRIEADLATADADARAFQASHAGRLASLSGRDLAAAMAAFEAIDETLGRVMSYAQLLFSADSTDAAAGQFYQSMMERCTAISAHILFFRLELNRIDDAVLDAKFSRSPPLHAGGRIFVTCASGASTSFRTNLNVSCTIGR